jgi:hypothetical protein
VPGAAVPAERPITAAPVLDAAGIRAVVELAPAGLLDELCRLDSGTDLVLERRRPPPARLHPGGPGRDPAH